MKLYIFGGYHQDPLHRIRLLESMKFLKSSIGSPDFIAVESNRAIFQAVILPQRKQFISLAQKDDEISKFSHKAIESLSKALQYEADTHEEVFNSDLNVIFLDDYRIDFSDTLDPCDTAKRYLQTCRNALRKCGEHFDNNDEVDRIVSSYMAEQAQGVSLESNKILREKFFYGEARSNPFERDEIWAKVIEETLSDQSGYAIIVAAVPHVFDKQGYLGALLKKQGHDCHFYLLSEIEQ